jgi:hypothetical protein
VNRAGVIEGLKERGDASALEMAELIQQASRGDR